MARGRQQFTVAVPESSNLETTTIRYREIQLGKAWNLKSQSTPLVINLFRQAYTY